MPTVNRKRSPIDIIRYRMISCKVRSSKRKKKNIVSQIPVRVNDGENRFIKLYRILILVESFTK